MLNYSIKKKINVALIQSNLKAFPHPTFESELCNFLISKGTTRKYVEWDFGPMHDVIQIVTTNKKAPHTRTEQN